MTSGSIPGQGSLVLYKGRPARVRHSGQSLEIELETGATQKVRPKDVRLLHPGPLMGLGDLRPVTGDVETAWELLAGSSTGLAELAELAYGTYSPPTAWAAWQLVADGLYFHGTADAISARSPEDLARERQARAARAAEHQAHAAFLQRARSGQVLPEDVPYLREVQELALGCTERSQVLRALARAESPESAHALLLDLGVWGTQVNPYPRRLGIAEFPPQVPLPELPAEPRLDLTHLTALAIDDAGSRDPDDAVSLDGGRLWVHVADVAALVPPGSPADLEARGRGASLYLPEGTVPMLPAQAVQTLALGLSDVSPALSLGLDLGPDDRVRDLQVVPSWIRVTRLTYDQAESMLGDEPLSGLVRLAEVHRERREEQGAVRIDLPEVKIHLEGGLAMPPSPGQVPADSAAPHGSRVVITPLPPLRSRDLVAEAMLMAGAAVARLAQSAGLSLPYATQPPPDERVVPAGLAGMVALRRTLKPTQYSGAPYLHAGLGLPSYVQVTSPLRRYLDLVAHQQLRAHLCGGTPLSAQEIVERIGAATAVLGGVAAAERLSRRHWTLVYLIDDPAWRGEGVLVELRGRRGVVLIPSLGLETTLPLCADLPLNSTVVLSNPKVSLATLDVAFRARV